MADPCDLELRPSEGAASEAESIALRRDELPMNQAASVVISGSSDPGHKSPAEPAGGFRRALWPWAWLAVTGVITIGWLIGMGWAAVELVKLFAG
jgi:hypothetical protein